MSRRPRASTASRSSLRERERSPRAVRPARRPTPNGEVVAITPLRSRRRGIVTTVAKVVVVTAVIGVTVFFTGQWALHQSLFRVQHVTMTGEFHETTTQLLTATHLDAHPAMIDLSPSTIQNDLSIYPWIGSISLTKRWPNTVQLAVHEIRAVAVAFDSRHVLRYVGSDGRALSPAPLTSNLPTLVTTPATLGAHEWPYRGVASAGALVAGQLPIAFAAQVSQVIVDAQGNVTLQLTTPLRFYLGSSTNLNAKFIAVASAIAHATFAPGDVVDVTTPNELSVTGTSPS